MEQTTMDILQAWAHKLNAEIGTGGIFLFGSLIYRGGTQFTDSSDIDLVVCIPNNVDTALKRTEWIRALLAHKIALENELSTLLNRDPSKSICSFVVPTPIELKANLHKDGSPAFFTRSMFLNLLNDEKTHGIPGAGTQPVSDPLGQMCLRFVQKKRNVFLNVSANKTSNGFNFDDTDPLPKDIMRHAAMAAELSTPSAEPGAEFDIQFGLDFLSNSLYQERTIDQYVDDIHNRLSIRRGARGTKEPVNPTDQLFLAEWIFDQSFQALDEREKAFAAAKSLPKLTKHSTVFFAERFASAFPGITDITWFEEREDIKDRLERLLKQPLVFENKNPIWWWRGGNYYISNFQELDDETFLIDVYELKIRKIAAVPSQRYYQNFVYIEADAMPPTGLYNGIEDRVEAALKRGDYYSEEYGLVDDKYIVTRGEFDDGAAKIEGKIQDIHSCSSLRVRYLTPYNFVVAAQMSPINNSQFDQILTTYLNLILSGTATLEELTKAVHKLPKSHY